MSPVRVAVLSLARGMACAIAISSVAAASQAEPPEVAVPTALEEELIEQSCAKMRPVGSVLDTDAYLDCRKTQLASLRADFGRDLRRLSPATRAKMDAACSGLRTTRGEDAYVSCLAGQLTTLRGRGGRSAQSPPAAPVAAAPEPPSPAPPPAAPPASAFPVVWIGAALAALAAILGGVTFMVVRARSNFGNCRTCGAKLTEHGELCHACRHEAAEVLRHAKNERVEQARAVEDEARRKQAAREQEEQQRARDEEMRRQQAQERQAREEEEQARQRREQEEEETRRRQQPQQQQTDAAASPDEFDPYAALGIPRTASAADIEAAYQEAKAKYDPDLVSGMSTELQEHFSRKGEAAQRAYELLITPPQ